MSEQPDDRALDDAMQGGCDACLNGQDDLDNPYSEYDQPELYEAWRRGWWDANGDIGVGG